MSHKRAADAGPNRSFYKFRRFEEPEDIFLEDLRGAVWSVKKSWKEIAEMAGVVPDTVGRFARGDTKRPTFHTIFRLCHALNMRLMRAEKVHFLRGRKK